MSCFFVSVEKEISKYVTHNEIESQKYSSIKSLSNRVDDKLHNASSIAKRTSILNDNSESTENYNEDLISR